MMETVKHTHPNTIAAFKRYGKETKKLANKLSRLAPGTHGMAYGEFDSAVMNLRIAADDLNTAAEYATNDLTNWKNA